MARAVRILILVLILPSALMPSRLDVCLDCLFGARSRHLEEARCPCCAATEADELPPCCARSAPKRDRAPALRSTPGPGRDCCLHVDNQRDELPAPLPDFSLPPAACELVQALLQPRTPRPILPRPVVEPGTGPPPERPLPLLI
ncbi:MAG: hypothetical protein H6807_08465 [Planctomycetes bacterium]|nr:hypothetical protein [Planctomycetota bacterium]